MFVMNMTFILSSDKYMYFMNGEASNIIYIFFHFTRSNKSHIRDKSFEFSFYYIQINKK